MGTAERRQRERAGTRDRILDAARDMFVSVGYEATTMRAIAERIEYTPTAIYHHFRNKEALFTELCAQDFHALGQAFRRIERIEDPVARIERIGAAYVDFALEYPMHYRLMFMTPRPPIAREQYAEHTGDPGETAYAFLRDTVTEAILSGRFRPEFQDPDELAKMLWAVVHGIVSIRIAKEHDGWIEFTDTRATAARLRDVIMRGLVR
jgi:AcrR family transcriptional regulator